MSKLERNEALTLTMIQWDHMAMYGVGRSEALNALGLMEKFKYHNKLTGRLCTHPCALCLYSLQWSEGCCLVKWPNTSGFIPDTKPACVNSYYDDWNKTGDPKCYKAKELAHKIADLALHALNKLRKEDYKI